ncbi:hypothetical protein RB595_000262 [Gaeumannomyces hyphopodioides]
MRLSSIVLSSTGLAAICSAAAIKVTPRATPKAPGFTDDVPKPVMITMEEDGEYQEEEPAAVIPGSFEQFVTQGGNATEAPPMLPSSGPAASISANGTLKARAVHGPDDRYTESGMQYPFSALGRITMKYDGRKSWCSGSLVGPRLVATARHCVKPNGAYTFAPAYYAGTRFAPATVTHVLHIDGTKKNGTCGYADDWAIFVLDRDLSATNGYLGVKAMTEDMMQKEIWWSYGYPQDRNRTGQLPFVNHNFKIWRPADCDRARSPLLHMADSSPGQSGSAIWLEPDAQGRRYQYGVHVASSSKNGILSTGPAWLNAVVAARKRFP